MRIVSARAAHREDGRIVTMVPLASLAALIAIGLGVDFSGQVTAEQQLRDIASHCARTAASNTSVARNPTLDMAESHALACLNGLSIDGTATNNQRLLTVTVSGTYRTKLLSIIGIDTLPLNGQASALISENL